MMMKHVADEDMIRQAVGDDEELAKMILAMYLRDMRKRASDLSDTLEHASELLQHSSIAITQKHYRTKVLRLKTVR